MAARMADVGLVTVSLRRSIMGPISLGWVGSAVGLTVRSFAACGYASPRANLPQFAFLPLVLAGIAERREVSRPLTVVGFARLPADVTLETVRLG